MKRRAAEKETALSMLPPKERPVIKVVATVSRNKIIWILLNLIGRVLKIH